MAVGTDLEVETGLPTYAGWFLEECTGGEDPTLEVSLPGDRVVLRPGEALGGVDADQLDALLIERTIRAHLDKELERRPLGIKVLSLFFVDRVEDDRVYDEHGNGSPGRLARLFEERYRELIGQQKYRQLFDSADATTLPPRVHDGYFARDKRTGRLKNTQDNDRGTNSADAMDAYDLIMNDKERLLSLDEPLKFIFSHSALREGWDNPNVFQICSLRKMHTERQRRQTLGRGLRLCVGGDGRRVRDESLNVLTVVAAEGYKAYAAGLQAEYREAGLVFGRVAAHGFARLTPGEGEEPVGEAVSRRLFEHLEAEGFVKANGDVTDKLRRVLKANELELPEAFAAISPAAEAVLREQAGDLDLVTDADAKARTQPRKSVIEGEAVRALWARISGRTTYRVELDGEALVKKCTAAVASLRIERARVTLSTAELAVDGGGVSAAAVRETQPAYLDQSSARLPDALAELERLTGLTRRTLSRVLRESGNLKEFTRNPRRFLTEAARVINEAKRAEMVGGVRYERDGREWAASLLREDEERALQKLVEGGTKSTLERVPCDSDVEVAFVRELDADPAVQAFAKLPRRFRVHTPLGDYEPDWAVVDGDGRDRLYLVVETKGTGMLIEGLRGSEASKIACAKKNFAEVAGEMDDAAEYVVDRTWDGVRSKIG